MNKLTAKLRRNKAQKTQRVTDSNIEEQREAVIAQGKKFKYPFQYAKHRIVIITVVIGVVAVALFGVFGWLQLYKFQNMSDIVYRFTRVIPVPVADVDGRQVLYSDYLMLYRSSIQALKNQQGQLATDPGEDESLMNQYKRQAMDSAEQYTYALKLADELGITVTQEQIAAVAREHRTVNGVERSDQAFEEIIQLNFGLSTNEYDRLLRLSIAKREVSIALDDTARDLAAQVEKLLASNKNDFAATAKALGDKVIYETTGSMVDIMNLDGGRATAAAALEVGQVSDRFVGKSGDCYYFVKLISKTTNEVNYASIRVPFTEFDTRFSAVAKDNKIKEYIELK